MCIPKAKAPQIVQATPAPVAIDNSEAVQQSKMESRLRRRRSGAAADVLTSATGIPSTTPTLGGVAR